MLYVGVDAHKINSQVTVVDRDGRILNRKQVRTSAEGFRSVLDEIDEPLKAVVEAGYSWGPTHDWLDEVCVEVVLAHPAKVRS